MCICMYYLLIFIEVWLTHDAAVWGFSTKTHGAQYALNEKGAISQLAETNLNYLWTH